MYDIHCHVLPCVDDGPKDISDSIEMCRAAANDGVKMIVATPHYIEGELQTEPSKVLTQVFLLNQELKSEDISLTVVPGMEVYITPNLLKLYNDKKIITLNCKNYILIELPLYNSLPAYLDDVLFNLEIEGVRPVIAHPERCKIINEHPNLIYELIKKDCIIQVNSGSLDGLFGKNAQDTVYKLLEHNMVHAVSSDSHSSQGRTSSLRKSFDVISKKLGKELAEELFISNQYKIIHGESINICEPVRIKKKKFWVI